MMEAFNSKECPKMSNRATEEMPLLTWSANKCLLQWNASTHDAKSLQMKSLNGFSNSSAWADGFTAESEIPRLGKIVSLPNPRCRRGFQLKPSLAHRALPQNQFFFKMNSR
jgi:hypothetical protein